MEIKLSSSTQDWGKIVPARSCQGNSIILAAMRSLEQHLAVAFRKCVSGTLHKCVPSHQLETILRDNFFKLKQALLLSCTMSYLMGILGVNLI